MCVIKVYTHISIARSSHSNMKKLVKVSPGDTI